MFTLITKVLRKIRKIPGFISRLARGALGRKQLLTLDRHKSYDDYVAKQVKKTTDPKRIENWKTKEWDSKVQGFTKVFSQLNMPLKDKKALCLGSRTGQEVFALQTLGANAMGIDLVAFPPYTQKGDVHDLQFQDGQFDLVFSNIFDHVLYPDKFAREASRVLAGGGLLVLRVQLGYRGDDFSETFITSEEPILELFSGLTLESQQELQKQFDAMELQLVFRKH